jgi:hypothetical protein
MHIPLRNNILLEDPVDTLFLKPAVSYTTGPLDLKVLNDLRQPIGGRRKEEAGLVVIIVYI